jgi:uncharacterized membrane protein YphA (DoxX/SURF4 family)
MSNDAQWVIQLSLGVTFALSTLSKLTDPVSFVRGVREYKILPRQGAVLFAVFVIVAELLLSISHLSGQMLRVAAPLGFALLVSFAAAVAITLARHRELPCLCFGAEGEMVSGRTLARLGITILGELILMLQPGFFSARSGRALFAASAHEAVIALAWTLFVLVAILWLLQVPELLDLARTRFSGQLAGHAGPDVQGDTR